MRWRNKQFINNMAYAKFSIDIFFNNIEISNSTSQTPVASYNRSLVMSAMTVLIFTIIFLDYWIKSFFKIFFLKAFRLLNYLVKL